MKWSDRTAKLWKAFEDAVLSRDKKQFELYHEFVSSKKLDLKNLKDTEEEVLVN